MNRFANQCYERCFCDFCKSSFSIRGSGTVHWPPVSILKSGMKHLRRDKSYQFQPPKWSQKEVSVLELSKSKSSVQREVSCWCFPKLASFAQKISYPLLQPGSVFKLCKILKKGWRTCIASPWTSALQSSSQQTNEHLFKYCIPLLIDFQAHVFGYPNTYFCIYKIFIWA